MEQIINQLVEIDAAGQALVRQAQDARKAEQAHMDEYKQEMYRQYLDQQKARVEKYKEFAQQEKERRLLEIEQTHAGQIARLRAAYEQHADEWVAQMVKRCIGR